MSVKSLPSSFSLWPRPAKADAEHWTMSSLGLIQRKNKKEEKELWRAAYNSWINFYI
jgi:hypothetical protein